jgi:hypothetical protein
MKQLPFGSRDIVLLPAMFCRHCGIDLMVSVKDLPIEGSYELWPMFVIRHPFASCKFSEQITKQSAGFYSNIDIDP